ncbi:MAG: PIN domain-containing protein [Fervidicoccaceae archaeon]|nr:MAG: 30S processome protein Utp24 [Fervidicoccus sp.]
MGSDKIAKRTLVLLDSNALLQLYKGVHLFEDIESALESSPEYICPDAILNELEKLSVGKGEIMRAAKLALEIAREKCKTIVTGEESGDRALIKLAAYLSEKGERVLVATSDRELRRKLSILGIKTAYYRESQHRFEVEAKDVL